MLKFVAEAFGNIDKETRRTLAKYGELYMGETQARHRAAVLNQQPGPFAPGTGQAGVDVAEWIVRLMYFEDVTAAKTPNVRHDWELRPTGSRRCRYCRVYERDGQGNTDEECETRVRALREAKKVVDEHAEGLAKPGYEPLLDVLLQMLEHAQSGKGHERHGGEVDVLQQPAVQNALTLGSIQGPAYQVMKKVPEAVRLAARGDYETARRNLVGAGNYCALAVLALDALQPLPVGKAPQPHPSHSWWYDEKERTWLRCRNCDAARDGMKGLYACPGPLTTAKP